MTRPEGWGDLADAFTVFGRSRRGKEPDRRGRFCLGEKLVLAMCREARIETMSGTVEFLPDGPRRILPFKCPAGTRFTGTLRLTRDEIAEITAAAGRLIAPVATILNGAALSVPSLLGKFEARLPTEIQDAEGNLRRTIRQTFVEAYEGDDGGEILEMGIPVCPADWPWRLNVLQKVPLGMERDSVTDSFRRALQVAALNALPASLDDEQAAAPWASEAIGDARVSPEALNRVIVQRFGERAVIATPNDPIANANAEATGCEVIHGGSLSAGAWANMRKHAIVPTTARPSPRRGRRLSARPSKHAPCASSPSTDPQAARKRRGGSLMARRSRPVAGWTKRIDRRISPQRDPMRRDDRRILWAPLRRSCTYKQGSSKPDPVITHPSHADVLS